MLLYTDCEDPPSITVGDAGANTGDKSPYAVNELITYNCAATYSLSGSRINTCQGSNFEWSLTGSSGLPQCLKGRWF